MELIKIKMALHTHKFALEPIIEFEIHFEIDHNQSLNHFEELFRFVVSKQLQKQEAI